MSSVKVEFLTHDEKMIKLCSLYWDVGPEDKFPNSVAQIAAEFGLKSGEVSKIVAANCKTYSEDDVCANCNAHFYYENRNDFQNRRRWPAHNQLCSKCLANEIELKKRVALEEANRKRRIIANEFALESSSTLDIFSLSLEEAIYLLSLIRVAASEDLTIIQALDNHPESLSPSYEYSVDILKQLYRAGLLNPHPDSPSDAFTFENDKVVSFVVSKVLWRLSIGRSADETRQVIGKLESTFRVREWWPYKWNEQVLPLWRKIALYECLEYLEVVLKEHNLPFNAGEKTHLVIENILETYSVGQAYVFIWRSGKDAAAYFMRERVAKQHAANTVVGSIQRQAERANAETWEVNPYKRDRRCPQSMISQVLFNTALKIGERGFTEAPHVIFSIENEPIGLTETGDKTES